MQEECASCKEIYYKAAATDSSIGAATVYRMVNLLEDIGAINRKNMYRISCGMNCNKENVCVIELDDRTICSLSSGEWYKVISEGLRSLGYVGSHNKEDEIVFLHQEEIPVIKNGIRERQKKNPNRYRKEY